MKLLRIRHRDIQWVQYYGTNIQCLAMARTNGQAKGGFYTHEWVENILRADIHNADSILPQFQILKSGDTTWLTPNPYFRKQGYDIQLKAF